MSDKLPTTLPVDTSFAKSLSAKTKFSDGVRQYICTDIKLAIGKAPLRAFQTIFTFHALREENDAATIDKGLSFRTWVMPPRPNPDADPVQDSADAEARRLKYGTYTRMGGDVLRALLGPEVVPFGFRKDDETGEWTFRGEEIPEGADREALKADHMNEVGDLLARVWEDASFRDEIIGCTLYAATNYNENGYINSKKVWGELPEDVELVTDENWYA